MKLLNKFLNFLSVQNYSEYTIRNYRFILKLFIQAISRKIKKINSVEINLGEVGFDDIIDYLGALRSKMYSVNTIKLRIIALRSFFGYLYQQGLYPRKLDIPLPRLEKRTIKILTEEEIKRILNRIPLETIRGYRDRAIIELLYVSGLRISEFTKLKAEDFQWIKLKAASKKQHLKIHIQGKGKRDRNLYINNRSANVVMNYLTRREDDSDYLFVSAHGQLSKESIRKILKKRARDARISKRVYPHILRHSIATHMLREGVNLFVLQNFLGHSSIESTRQYLELLDVDYRFAGENVIPKILYGREKDE